jgi:spermidine synthase
MMGATFPALTRHLARSISLSGAFGRLYAANTVGAIAGTLLAGLVLIEVLGLSGALAVGAGCSLVAGLLALAIDRREPAAADRPGTATPAQPSPSASAPSSPSPSTTTSTARVRLALGIAFVSGFTSLGYQVAWTRLLASGTGNTTYVFTVILAIFLFGIAVGALAFNVLRARLRDPVRVLAVAQAVVAILAIAGLVGIIGNPTALDPGRPLETIGALFGTAFWVVFPVTVTLGIAFPTASALLRDDASEAGTESGSLLAVNTTGAILGSLVIPFALIPLVGSPMVVVLLATINATLAVGLAVASRPRSIPALAVGLGTLAVVLVTAVRPGTVVQPNEALIASRDGALFDSNEDEIASVQAGQIRSTPELWVAGTSMTLLTVDAKLMPILPLIARPDAKRALVVAFGMGTSFRSALIAGLRTDAVELVPSVPRMFGHYYGDAAEVLADPDGRVIVTDGRNHLELTDERFDIIVTDPPPPIESSGASVISSLEYYRAGREHLTPGGVMMQWVPYGAPEPEFKEHIRTFGSVFPHVEVVRGAGGYGAYMLGSDEPIELEPDAIREVLGRPGVLEDISSAYDSPATTVDGWIDVIEGQRWLDDDTSRSYTGDGPLITDDRPRPEYFLLRRLSDGIEDR